MRFFVLLPDMFGSQVSVDLRRRDTRVAQQFLDVPQRRPSVQQMRRKAVTQRMRSDVAVDAGNSRTSTEP